MSDGVFDPSARVCVIGAGPTGIAAVKALLDQGYHNVVAFDRGSDVGGNWVFDDSAGHSSVFETTHIISSKAFSQYDDYPMPEHCPDYPSHWLLADYFQSYARHFDLYPFIRFGTSVESCAPLAEGGWSVRTIADATPREQRFDVRSPTGTIGSRGGPNTPASWPASISTRTITSGRRPSRASECW